jgi:hypothetical protein
VGPGSAASYAAAKVAEAHDDPGARLDLMRRLYQVGAEQVHLPHVPQRPDGVRDRRGWGGADEDRQQRELREPGG